MNFPPNYYNVIALFLLLLIIVTFTGLIYFEERRKVTAKKSFSILKVSALYKYTFYVFIFGVIIYMFYHYILSSDTIPNDRNKNDLIKNYKILNENNVRLLTDSLDLSAGKTIYEANCIACHKIDGGGLVGPNLTDKYWILGGGIKNIFYTITKGVPQKGMISWQTQLNPKQVQQVASYVISLQGTTTADPKPPEGEIWKEENDK